jgi:hypothetical protein
VGGKKELRGIKEKIGWRGDIEEIKRGGRKKEMWRIKIVGGRKIKGGWKKNWGRKKNRERIRNIIVKKYRSLKKYLAVY